MVLGVNMAMFVAGIGESAKNSSIWRLLRQTATPVSSSPNGVIPLKDRHPAPASSGLALNWAMRPRMSQESVLNTATSAIWNTTYLE